MSDEGLHAGSFVPLLRTLFRKAGLPTPNSYSSHSLRRGFATWANSNGWDLKMLMEYVGWKDVRSAIRADGRKEVLGLWIEQTEGAKFWLKVFNELKNRGLHDILIAVVDGLRGFLEAIEAVYPAAQIQTCIVHLIRNSLNLASWKDRKPLAAAIKPIYQAATAEAAAAALDAFAQSEWGRKFPTVAAMWQRQWEQVIPFFAYPPEVRRIVYTTNAIESMHMQLRKIVKNRGHFPSDEAASKLLYLALRNIEKDWKMPPIIWRQAVNQFAILFGERFTSAIS
ncbi:IS256 family transposase [Burkholderia ubonensis]|nr:IS256 family transposase [Burkholderia ubonensis]